MAKKKKQGSSKHLGADPWPYGKRPRSYEERIWVAYEHENWALVRKLYRKEYDSTMEAISIVGRAAYHPDRIAAATAKLEAYESLETWSAEAREAERKQLKLAASRAGMQRGAAKGEIKQMLRREEKQREAYYERQERKLRKFMTPSAEENGENDADVGQETHQTGERAEGGTDEG